MMSGRHRSRRHAAKRKSLARRLPLPLVAGVVALALIGAAAAVGFSLNNRPEGAAIGINCDGSIPLNIAAAPSIAPVVKDLAAEHQRRRPSVDGVCVTLSVESRSSAEVIDAVTTGATRPTLWIPDSALAATQLADRVEIDNHGSIATSPLVVVAPRAAAEQLGWPDEKFSWTAVLGGELTAAIVDPASSAEGLATLLAVRTVLGDAGTSQEELVGAMLSVSRNALPNTQAGFDQMANDAQAAPLFTATEQEVIAHNKRIPTAPVVALYPSEGTHILEFPALSLAGDEQTAQAVAAFVEVLRSPDGQAALLADGFRAPDGSATEEFSTDKGVVGTPPTALPTPTPEEAAGLIRQWTALTLNARLLAVMDVSGSMREKAPGGRTRVELAAEAATAALGLFPDGSDIGLWAFSILQDPPNDYIELVSLGPVTEEYDGATRREALVKAVQSLPDRARGGTGLYDTALAAFRTVRNTYDPGKVNSVVLMTDGRNEDDNGIDLDTLLKTLRAEVDPARPVPLITIGMGPDVDMDALTKISELTGGKAYQAEDPNDIQQVFLDAMVERQCRPNC